MRREQEASLPFTDMSLMPEENTSNHDCCNIPGADNDADDVGNTEPLMPHNGSPHTSTDQTNQKTP